MAYERNKYYPDCLALWILFSAWSTFSGWCLSAIQSLSLLGITFSYSLFLGALILFRFHLRGNGRLTIWKILRSRYLAPKIWLLLAFLAFVGGLAYSPNNYDYLTYRFPRVLSWTWVHAWYWIPTVNARINYSGTGFEWLMVPLFIIFKTDRLFFLINFISYLFLPGLVFSVFSSLGISKRIAWWWMWVLPSGYCYILQAASAGNDSFAAIYFLASLYFIFQAKASSPVKNLMLSCFAIALLTGAKAANLPLLLPWAIAVFSYRTHFFEAGKPVAIAMILVAATSVSFLPTALLNIHFTGDYAGDPYNRSNMKLNNPVVGVIGNSLLISEANLVPPILPGTVDWSFMLPAKLKAELRRDFPRVGFGSVELQLEEEAGPGLGVVLFAGLFIIARIWAKVADIGAVARRNRLGLWIAGAAVVAVLTYMSKMGSEAASRLIAAYYPLLIAAVLVWLSLDGKIVHRRPFRWVAFIAMLSAMPLVILSPARPLFPVQIFGDILSKSHVPAKLVARYNDVYRVYSMRAEAFNDLLATIPAGERTIGFLQNGNAPEAPLWRPFGARRVIEVTLQDSIDKIKAQEIHFVVVSQDALANTYHVSLDSVIANWSASVVVEKKITLTVQKGPEIWYLIHL